ncbi:3047_t:CDS:2, partial [Dentiscutata heterogama]
WYLERNETFTLPNFNSDSSSLENSKKAKKSSLDQNKHSKLKRPLKYTEKARKKPKEEELKESHKNLEKPEESGKTSERNQDVPEVTKVKEEEYISKEDTSEEDTFKED